MTKAQRRKINDPNFKSEAVSNLVLQRNALRKGTMQRSSAMLQSADRQRHPSKVKYCFFSFESKFNFNF